MATLPDVWVHREANPLLAWGAWWVAALAAYACFHGTRAAWTWGRSDVWVALISLVSLVWWAMRRPKSVTVYTRTGRVLVEYHRFSGKASKAYPPGHFCKVRSYFTREEDPRCCVELISATHPPQALLVGSALADTAPSTGFFDASQLQEPQHCTALRRHLAAGGLFADDGVLPKGHPRTVCRPA